MSCSACWEQRTVIRSGSWSQIHLTYIVETYPLMWASELVGTFV